MAFILSSNIFIIRDWHLGWLVVVCFQFNPRLKKRGFSVPFKTTVQMKKSNKKALCRNRRLPNVACFMKKKYNYLLIPAGCSPPTPTKPLEYSQPVLPLLVIQDTIRRERIPNKNNVRFMSLGFKKWGL